MDHGKFNRFTPGFVAALHEEPHPSNVAQIATVTKVTSAGAWFVLPAEPLTPYGPAPWGLGSYATRAAAITAGWKPLVGDMACVVFAGVGVVSPVVLAWWRP